MDNQHRQIKGYGELSQEEIALMNVVKSQGGALDTVMAMLRGNPDIDQRWLSIGQTHLQQGLMALTRSIARPDFF